MPEVWTETAYVQHTQQIWQHLRREKQNLGSDEGPSAESSNSLSNLQMQLQDTSHLLPLEWLKFNIFTLVYKYHITQYLHNTNIVYKYPILQSSVPLNYFPTLFFIFFKISQLLPSQASRILFPNHSAVPPLPITLFPQRFLCLLGYP